MSNQVKDPNVDASYNTLFQHFGDKYSQRRVYFQKETEFQFYHVVPNEYRRRVVLPIHKFTLPLTIKMQL